jgi:hypothetical protein
LVEVRVKCPPFSQLIAEAEIEGVPLVESLHHSALLPHWLRCLHGKGDLAVLHVDSHSDLGSPNLVMEPSAIVVDRWSREEVSVTDLTTVQRAVDSSAIEIGSYLTAALSLLPIRGVAWVHAPVDGNGSRPDPPVRSLRLDWSNSDPLDSSLRRLCAIRNGLVEDGPPENVWFVDASTPVCDGLARLGDFKIILDIDLDYFDNSGHSGHEQFGSTILDQRQDLFIGVVGSLDPARIAAIGIAHSPGFCPAATASRLSSDLVVMFTQWLKHKQQPCFRQRFDSIR